MVVERLTGEIKRVKTDRVKRRRWWGRSRERKRARETDRCGRDKRERVGSGWKLSTNLKKCIGGKKRRLAHIVRVPVEGGGGDGG